MIRMQTTTAAATTEKKITHIGCVSNTQAIWFTCPRTNPENSKSRHNNFHGNVKFVSFHFN